MIEVLNERKLEAKDYSTRIFKPSIAAKPFEKVSYTQFMDDMIEEYPYFAKMEHEEELRGYYDNIKLPTRSTDNSAGYDFYSPFKFKMVPGTTVKIPTGIRVDINSDWWLLLCPKSGHGFKTQVHLANTLGVDDADYYYSDNKGHLFIKLVMPHNIVTRECNRLFDKIIDTHIPSELVIEQGEKFAQGIFLPYGITLDDELTEKETRNGGFGSTGKF
jgi:dUTP pyrophosphatase